ncbi:hypothetical protein MMC07_002901 [Pseudocyphellaria aurata]|nr:hypothetical protein [Pseudocyphellaria aurata]
MHHRDLESWKRFLRGSRAVSTAEVTMMGLRVVFTVDPENIKAIHATQFADYGKGSRFHRDWQKFLGDSIFTTDGDVWHASRRLIRPLFVTERVSDLQIFERKVQLLISIIEQENLEPDSKRCEETQSTPQTMVDIHGLFLRYTLDTATEFLLGESVNSLEKPQQEFSKALADVARVQSLITKSGPANIFIPRASYSAGLNAIDKFVAPIIERALSLTPEELASRMQSKYTFLQALANLTQDPKILRDQILAILMAGRDTTASALSWVFYELARHPEITQKLRAEIMDTIGLDTAPTYEDLKGMPYLQNTINETLRLYPSVPLNLRIALHDTTLPRGGGPSGALPVGILKDTIIGYSTIHLQRREDLYPANSHPLAFDPDRWLRWQPQPWHYIPFSLGPRICLGQQFATTEIGYTIVRILQRFEFVTGSNEMDEEPRLKAEIVLQPADGVQVRFSSAA